jgi:hypothetical protein
MGCQIFMPDYEQGTKSQLQQEAEEEMAFQALMKSHYNRIYNGQQQPPQGMQFTPPDDDRPTGGIYGQLGRFGLLKRPAV